MHFLRGEEDINFLRTEYDVEEESVLGAYVGVRTDLTERIGLDVELQVTGGAHGVAVGLPWRF